jgi:hypothetical protein
LAFEVVTGVTGNGLHTFASFYTPIGVYVDVTALAFAEPRDLAAPIRYIKIGWFALVDTDPDVGGGIVGDFMHEPIFLFAEKQWIERKLKLDASTAATGFTWQMRPGVSADFFFF